MEKDSGLFDTFVGLMAPFESFPTTFMRVFNFLGMPPPSPRRVYYRNEEFERFLHERARGLVNSFHRNKKTYDVCMLWRLLSS